MPSTALLDTASRLSTSFYEVDPQQGGIYQAVANLTKTLLGISDLTPAERDYYGILTTYLLCAWDGRELDAAGGSATEQRSKKRAEREQLNQLFE
jgi:hypothetical protein